jgi:DNA-binding MarR family transcriptional regulator
VSDRELNPIYDELGFLAILKEKNMSESEKTSAVRCIRAPRDSQHPYFMTARAVAQDMTLTLDERGLLWYILSLPDDWVAHPMQLGKVNGIKSKEKIYRLFKSLMKAGYCERKNLRKDGRHEATIYVFYEEKQQRLIDLYKNGNDKEDSFLKNRNQEEQIPEEQVPKKQDPVKQDITDKTYTTTKKKNTQPALPTLSFDYEKQEFVGITEQDLATWKDLYPGIDIQRELGKMRQWLIDPENPERSGNRTFITNWLNKAAPKKLSKSQATQQLQEPKRTVPQDFRSIIPYNSSIAYSILREEGVEEYIDYLKSVVEKKYYENFEKGIFEEEYRDYLKQKGGAA